MSRCDHDWKERFDGRNSDDCVICTKAALAAEREKVALLERTNAECEVEFGRVLKELVAERAKVAVLERKLGEASESIKSSIRRREAAEAEVERLKAQVSEARQEAIAEMIAQAGKEEEHEQALSEEKELRQDEQAEVARLRGALSHIAERLETCRSQFSGWSYMPASRVKNAALYAREALKEQTNG